MGFFRLQGFGERVGGRVCWGFSWLLRVLQINVML